MAKIVVALGGNALGKTPLEQREIVKNTAKNLVKIILAGHKLIICHGNGPQVGMINLGFGIANKANPNQIPDMPLPECGSMSQGYIAYDLQQALKFELEKNNIKTSVAGIVTQCLVDASDPAFSNPTKPVGAFYSEQEAKKLAKENNWTVKEDAGRGWRRVVASPQPIDIVEKDIIEDLVKHKYIPIAVGGGGIPVSRDENGYHGKDAVIDKDFASAKLADLLDADKLIILTAVPNVMVNYNKPNQKKLTSLTVKEANEYIAQKQFAAGSMLPKIQAALKFVDSKSNRSAVIAALDDAINAIEGKAGTQIIK